MPSASSRPTTRRAARWPPIGSATLLGGKGRVLVLRYQEGSASTEAREKGFLDRMKAQYPAVQIVSADQFAGPTRDTAKRASENLLNRFGNQVEGIFTPNESSTAGMLLALQDVGKAGQVKFVGFDSSEAFVTAMRNKQLDGVVLQNPFEMGYQGVKTMVAHLKGQADPGARRHRRHDRHAGQPRHRGLEGAAESAAVEYLQ